MSEETKYLFIGGSADGEWLATDGSPVFRVPVTEGFPNFNLNLDNGPCFEESIKSEVYISQRLHDIDFGMESTHIVYVPDNKHEVGIIGQLMFGYKRKP